MVVRRRAVNTSAQGRDLELAVMALLRERGWTTMRSAGSKGIADVVALPDYTLQVPGMRLVLVQCKVSNANIGPSDRADLTSLAHRSNALPLVATRADRGTGTRVQYREATGMWVAFRELTGPGPKDWTEWHPPAPEGG